MLNHLTIVTTLRCDLKCQHCLRGFPKERPDFPLDLLDKLLTEALPFGANHVALTGGEPHLHPNFEKMVHKIVDYGYTWHFVSHGQRTEPYLAVMEKCKDKISHVTLSIDGATAKTHDSIRQRKGSFEKVVVAVKKYTNLGYKVRISATLNQKNKGDVEAMIQLARDLGAFDMKFGGTIPTSWNSDLVLSDNEFMDLYNQILKLRERAGFDISTVSSLHTAGGVNFCANLNFRRLTMNSWGELVFCCDTIGNGAVIGSLRECSLAELLERWLEQLHRLQSQRLKCIATGNMGNKFDNCGFCECYFTHQFLVAPFPAGQ